jgi:hypothetical protein
LQVHINVATPSGVVSAGTIQIKATRRIKLANDGAQGLEFSCAQTHDVSG